VNKKILLVALVGLYAQHTLASQCSTKAPKREAKKEKKAKDCGCHPRSWYTRYAVGGAFYKILNTTIEDSAGDSRSLTKGTNKGAPFGQITAGMQWGNFRSLGDQPGNLKVALNLSYAGRKKGVAIDFNEAHLAIPQLQLVGNVKDFRIMLDSTYDYYNSERCTLFVAGGIIAGIKTLSNVGLYHREGTGNAGLAACVNNNTPYTGQGLTPTPVHCLGQLRWGLSHQTKDNFNFEFNYSFTTGNVRFKKEVNQTAADPCAGHHANPLLIIGGIPDFQKRPRIRLIANAISISIFREL